jgi:AraC-like DNA-binding protein
LRRTGNFSFSGTGKSLEFGSYPRKNREPAAPAARLQAIKSDVGRNLGDCTLTVGSVAARHGVTPRYIHKLFESEGVTFSQFVLGRRLAAAHRLLTDRHLDHRPVAAVAFDVGFGDLSYFNRTFRRRYNATPSEVRAQSAVVAVSRPGGLG